MFSRKKRAYRKSKPTTKPHCSCGYIFDKDDRGENGKCYSCARNGKYSGFFSYTSGREQEHPLIESKVVTKEHSYNECADCGERITPKAKYCQSCQNDHRRTSWFARMKRGFA
jgi:hypothetical protein